MARREPRPSDSPGGDVPERLEGVHVLVVIRYQRPNPKPRIRGGATAGPGGTPFRREAVQLNRAYTFNFGPEYIAEGMDRELWRQIALRGAGRTRWEGWPDREQTSPNEVRPGA